MAAISGDPPTLDAAYDAAHATDPMCEGDELPEYDAHDALYEEIIETPALSMAGIAVKLAPSRSMDGDDAALIPASRP